MGLIFGRSRLEVELVKVGRFYIVWEEEEEEEIVVVVKENS